jgi:hypothetical protein
VAIAVHPLLPTEQVETLVLDWHCAAPAVHAFVQQDAAPAAPLHAPLLHDELVVS